MPNQISTWLSQLAEVACNETGIYAAAKAELMPDVEHIQDKRSNNRA